MADYRYQLFFLSCLSGSEQLPHDGANIQPLLSCLSGSEPVEFSDLRFERQGVIPVLAEIPSFLLACAH
jgi:hypothetical protein